MKNNWLSAAFVLLTTLSVCVTASCPEGWSEYDGNCFIYKPDDHVTFNMATSKCRHLGGTLASVHSQEENLHHAQEMRESNTHIHFWIGMFKVAKGYVAEWVDGSSLEFQNFASSQPSLPASSSRCVAIDGQPDVPAPWYEVSCLKHMGYICKYTDTPSEPSRKSSGHCPAGVTDEWMETDRGCIMVVENLSSWEAAETQCELNQGSLLSLHHPDDMDALSNLQLHSQEYWIGLRKTTEASVFLWSDGSPFNWLNWHQDYPDDLNHGDCGALSVAEEGNTWKNKACGVNKPFICRADKVATSVEDDKMDDGKLCPGPEWVRHDFSCFLFRPNGQQTWQGAQEECGKQGGHLAKVKSDEENNYMHQQMTILWGSQEDPMPRYWIGLHKKDQGVNEEEMAKNWCLRYSMRQHPMCIGDRYDPQAYIRSEQKFMDRLKKQYIWVGNETGDYRNWEAGEPNGHNDQDNCVEVLPSRGWNDENCGKEDHGYVCQAALKQSPVKLIDWVDYNDYEYFFSHTIQETSEIWDYARWFCNQNAAHLASILDSAENQFITNKFAEIGYSGDYWTGLNRFEDGVNFKWVDGKDLTYTAWGPDQPDTSPAGQTFKCGAADDSGDWYSANCGEQVGFVCKRLKDSGIPIATPPTPVVTGYCPNGWIGISGYNKCYKVVKRLDGDEGWTWYEAAQQCLNENAPFSTLASIENSIETALITSQLHNVSYGLWIGLYRDEYYTQWKWISNDPYYESRTNWGPGEPQGYDNCGEVWIIPGPPGTWNNIPCDTAKRGYICESYKDSNNPIATPPSTTTNVCMSGWTPYMYACYKVETLHRGWQAAEMNCANQGGHLVSAIDAAENAAIQLLTKDINSHYWIGLREDSSNTWLWQDGWYVFYTNWDHDQPASGIQGGGCAASGPEAKWQNMNCDNSMASVCKINNVPPVTAPPAAEGYCPDGLNWIAHGSYCYYFSTDYYEYDTWQVVLTTCMGFGGSLVSIHSIVENDFLVSEIQRRTSFNEVWIGFFQSKNDNSWMWSDMSGVQFTRWAPGEPNPEEKQCAVLRINPWRSFWVTSPCNGYKHFVCKMPKLPVTQPPPPVEGECPNEGLWEDFGHKCFSFSPDTQVQWTDALNNCNNIGGTLVKIESSNENNHIHQRMKDLTHFPNLIDFWIGLSKKDRNSPLLWTDGTDPRDVYENWASGEPNDSDGTQRCVEVYGGPYGEAQWNDHLCEHLKGYVCQANKSKSSGADWLSWLSRILGLSGGAIFGIIIGVLLGLVVLGLLAFLGLYFYKNGRFPTSIPDIKGGLTNDNYSSKGSSNNTSTSSLPSMSKP